MKRILYILLGLFLTTATFATKVTLQPDENNWHTAMPNDTLYVGKNRTILLEIPQIEKNQIERTT